MKYLMLLFLLSELLSAKTITLNQIVNSSKKNNKSSQALMKNYLALEAKNKADTASDPLEIFATKAKVKPLDALDGYEYSLGFSKAIKLGHIQKKDQKITRLNNEANLLESKIEIASFHQAIKNIYHQHCIDKESYRTFRANYNDFAKLFAKKQKAYNYQEISKAELLQLSIEKKQLYAKLQEANMRQERSKKFLLTAAHLTYNSKTYLSCRDRYPIKSFVTLPKDALRYTKSAYKKRIESSKTAIKRHNSAIDSITVIGQYDNELDSDRYSIGVSIPLNFTSSRSEEEKVAAMYNESATRLKYEETMHQKKAQITQLRESLKSIAMTIATMRQSINAYRNELLPLVKKSYELGESSVIEYLLNRQKYYELQSQLFETKRAYYQSLFTLYSVIETKE